MMIHFMQPPSYIITMQWYNFLNNPTPQIKRRQYTRVDRRVSLFIYIYIYICTWVLTLPSCFVSYYSNKTFIPFTRLTAQNKLKIFGWSFNRHPHHTIQVCCCHSIPLLLLDVIMHRKTLQPCDMWQHCRNSNLIWKTSIVKAKVCSVPHKLAMPTSNTTSIKEITKIIIDRSIFSFLSLLASGFIRMLQFNRLSLHPTKLEDLQRL